MEMEPFFAPTLGSISPLLEVLFALNLAVGIWEGSVQLFIKGLQKEIEKNEEEREFALQDQSGKDNLEILRDIIECVKKGMVEEKNYEGNINSAIQRGKVAGLVVAAIILMVLFLSGLFPNYSLLVSWKMYCLVFIVIISLLPFMVTLICVKILMKKWSEKVSETNRIISDLFKKWIKRTRS